MNAMTLVPSAPLIFTVTDMSSQTERADSHAARALLNAISGERVIPRSEVPAHILQVFQELEDAIDAGATQDELVNRFSEIRAPE